MSNKTSASLVCAALAAAVFAACGGSVITGAGGSGATGGGANAGPYDTCTVATECAWGEIDKEILSPADCPCLFGCPYLPLSKETVDRRTAQYQSLCTPGQDGQGNGCGIDDCASPPQIACQAGHCAAAVDAGP